MENVEQCSLIRQHAISLLARREHAQYELQRKLLAKGYELSDILDVLEELKSEGLQSDHRYCEAFVRSRAVKGHGPYRIRMELQERKVDELLIDEFLYSDEQDWNQLAIDVRQKRFGNRPVTDMKDRAKQQRFLQYRGFDSDQINAAMRQQT